VQIVNITDHASLPDEAGMVQPQSQAERRSSDRQRAIMRVAKLVSRQGEFICILRDVSSGGVGIRAFHDLPLSEEMSLVLGNGASFPLRHVRGGPQGPAFAFQEPVDVVSILQEPSPYPKRAIRFEVSAPMELTVGDDQFEVIALNLSQQGVRIETDARLAIDQPVVLSSQFLPDIEAKVRWRRHGEYGLVFQTSFTLHEFSLALVKLQCPSLLPASARLA
jgi:hypothetical protein